MAAGEDDLGLRLALAWAVAGIGEELEEGGRVVFKKLGDRGGLGRIGRLKGRQDGKQGKKRCMHVAFQRTTGAIVAIEDEAEQARD
jgi:hypothetical protein